AHGAWRVGLRESSSFRRRPESILALLQRAQWIPACAGMTIKNSPRIRGLSCRNLSGGNDMPVSRVHVIAASIVLALSAGGLAMPPAVAAPHAESSAQASPFGALHWRMIGPFRAGRTLAVTGVPGQPTHFYMGSVDGGVWETHDTGRTWQPLFDDQPVQSIGAIAVAPSNPSVLYVGTGESDMRSDIVQGDGMYKSVD